MSDIRKSITQALKKKIVRMRGNPAHFIMLSVQGMLVDNGYQSTAHHGLVSVVTDREDGSELKVFELNQFPTLNYEVCNLINEIREYAGIAGKKWSEFKSNERFSIEEENYIPTDKEVTEFGYEHLADEGNSEGKKYDHDKVVQSVYNTVVAYL